MLMHGRVTLTANSFMLDECRSLFQKSLRRKDASLVCAVTKELMINDQLPWKTLLTCLFEDHCLSNHVLLDQFLSELKQDNKTGCVEILFNAYTSRIAACLPVIALDPQYRPNACQWSATAVVSSDLAGLVFERNGSINFDILLYHIVEFWKKNEQGDSLIGFFKLATIVVDHEERTITYKGRAFLLRSLTTGETINVGLLVISALYRATSEADMKRYLNLMFDFAALPDANVRLILFSIYAQLAWGGEAKQLKHPLVLGQMRIAAATPLNDMPKWAVDKHTYRGRCGKSTRSFVADKISDMAADRFETFHGSRPKVGIEHFFAEGCKCEKPALKNNPLWARTQQIYLEQERRLQKTLAMTEVYYQRLQAELPAGVFHAPISHKRAVADGSSMSKKRRGDSVEVDEVSSPKLFKQDPTEFDKVLPLSIPLEELEALPLLQVPTGRCKVYVRLHVESGTVYKGPYKLSTLNRVVFLHRVLSDVLSDPHVLALTRRGLFATFPLVKSENSTVEVSSKSFRDAITGSNIKDQKFIERDALGLIQLHKLSSEQLAKVPHTVWLHFLYRFLLNVGDSGLYNALTDQSMTFFYGIDLEENRGKIKGIDVLNLMFVKLPQAKLRPAILSCLKLNKQALLSRLNAIKHDVLLQITDLAGTLYPEYNSDIFVERIAIVKSGIERL